MSTPITSSSSPVVPDTSMDAESAAKKEALKKELLKSAKKLIAPGIKYFFVAKLNGFTGEKFKCLRNWEKSSGQALLQSVNDNLSPVINKLLSGIKDQAPEKLSDLKASILGSKNTDNLKQVLFDKSGLGQSLDTCENFMKIACDLLSQTDQAGKPQTVNRLLTIVGVLHSGNKNVGKIIDDVIAPLSDYFFKEGLPKILKAKHGKLGGLAGKFVTILGVKGLVDRFLRKCILENRKFSVGQIKDNGDVYEKLILKGVSTFVDIHGSGILELEDILEDDALNSGLKEQIEALRESYKDDELAKGLVGTEKVFVREFLRNLKEEDIGPVTVDLLSALKAGNAEKVDEIIGENIQSIMVFSDKFLKNSGHTLVQAVNNNLSPVVNKLLPEIKTFASDKLKEELRALTGTSIVSEMVRDVSGLNQVSDICEQFLTVSCDLLMQTEKGVPHQTINRLLTIAGVSYTGNADIEVIVNNALHAFFAKKFKSGKDEHSVKSTAAVLLGKHVVDNCLAALKGSEFSVDHIKDKGDVYEKLILKGVSTFVDIKGIKDKDGNTLDELTLDTILKDKKLAPELQEKIKALEDSYSESRLLQVGQLAVGSEKIFIQTFLSKIKDKDITELFKKNKENKDNKDSLEGILMDTAKACLWSQVKPTVSAVGSCVTTLGEAVISLVEVVSVVGSRLWNAFWGSDNSKVGEQDPASEAQREVKTEERAVPERFETLKKEEDLVDDCVEFITKSLNEGQTVEQKSEESTGIVTVLCNAGNAALEGAKAVAGWICHGVNWICGTSSRKESEKRTVQEVQDSKNKIGTEAKPGVQPQPEQEPQMKDTSVERDSDASKAGVAQAVKDASQPVAQPQVNANQQRVEAGGVEAEENTNPDVTSDDVKASVSVVDQSKLESNSDVSQKTAQQVALEPGVAPSNAAETKQATDSESRTEPQGNVVQEVDSSWSVGGVVNTVWNGVVDTWNYFFGTGGAENQGAQPQDTRVEGEPDKSLKATVRSK